MPRCFFPLLFLFIQGAFAQQLESVADSLPPLPEMLNYDTARDSIPTLLDSIQKTKDTLQLVKENGKAAVKQKSYKRNVLRSLKPMEEVTIEDYKIMYSDGRQTFLDTTLTIYKDYRFNYLRRDYFELLPLPNMGEGFNRMGYDFLTGDDDGPQLGARAKHYRYFEVEDIPYFEVPSPVTELFFKTSFEQGQFLDALITANISPQFNFSVAHTGFRSIGKYVSSKSTASQVRMGGQFRSWNQRYQLRFHYAAQNLGNQQNGGLDFTSIFFFETAPNYPEFNLDGTPVLDENGDQQTFFYDGFLDRSRLTTQIKGENNLVGKRYYLGQQYDFSPTGTGSSTTHKFQLKHEFNYETKFYDFSQFTLNNFLGSAYVISNVYDRNQLFRTQNKWSLKYRPSIVGTFDFGLQHTAWKYFFPVENEYTPTETHPSEIKAQQWLLSTRWKQHIFAKFDFEVFAQKALKAAYATDILNFKASGNLTKTIDFEGGYQYRKQPLNFNFHLYQSDYINYNWHNTDFNPQEFSVFWFKAGHAKWGHVSASWNRIKNYAFFKDVTDPDLTIIQFLATPSQAVNPIDYYKVRFFQHLNFGKFSLINTVQYQKVAQQNAMGADSTFSPLNVPKGITRNTLMFSSHIFKKALYLQTGLTFQYATSFYADRYNPLLGEFVSQSHTSIGEYPRVDFFFNGKIQQTRVYVKYEHLNSHRTGYDYYAAPFIPYRDGILRFGLVWNFFQ